jgi:ATP-dependent DNA helicase RecG
MTQDRYPPDIPALLNRGMGAELHWYPEDVPPSRLAATLVGMANTSGGSVLIGIAPRSGQVIGVREPAEIVDRVFQAALLPDPPLVLPVPQVQRVDRAFVLVVVVPPGLPHVYSLEGRFLGREGSQTNPLPARRLRHLLLERGVIQFESRVPPDIDIEELDPDQVTAYVRALNLPCEEGFECQLETLVRRGCLRRVEGALRPTYAGLLLFGSRPQQWLPNASLLMARFSGVAFSDRFVKEEATGTLPDQLRQAERFIRENVRSVVRLVGLTHQEMPEYPFEAVRELLVNAVAHRDYSIQGDNIHLNIFADRIEVHSPGGLPGPVTLENLLKARFSRNAVIVQTLSDLGFVERLGYGLDRVVTVMRQNDLRPPRFEEVAGSFRVTLFGESEIQSKASLPDLSVYRHLNPNPRQEMALAYLARHQRITNHDFQDLCPEVHAETLRRDLADLVTRGALIKVGDKRATYYILK